MSNIVFKISEERFLEQIPWSKLTSIEGSPMWIDIRRRDPETLGILQHALGLHTLAVKACLEVSPSSRLGIYGKSFFIGLPILNDIGERVFVSILCLPGKLITVHDEVVPALDSIMAQFVSSMKFHTSGIPAVLYQILDHIIDQDVLLTLEAHERIDHIEDALDRESTSGLPDEMRGLKRRLINLEAILEDQHHCVSALQTIESEAFNINGLQDYFRDAIRHLEHAVRSADRQTDRLTGMQQHYLVKLQDDVNKHLQTLTVISAIFMPLMLITGIYGMNFRHMPELSWEYGYLGVLIVMVLVAGVLSWFFHGKGWLK